MQLAHVLGSAYVSRMSHFRLTSLSVLSTAFLFASCGGRTYGEPPADQESDTSGTVTSPASDGDQSQPSTTATEGEQSSGGSEPEGPNTVVPPTTSTTIPPSTTTTVTPPDDPTETSSEVDGGGVVKPPVIVDPPAPVCPDQCGNDVVDSCDICTTGPGPGVDPVSAAPPNQDLLAPPIDPICTTVTEQCDGALAPEQTCVAIGFVGGTLSCGSACRYDDAQCESCLANPETQACRDDLAVGKKPRHVALATNETALAAAWDEDCVAKVGWFDASLDTLHTTTLEGAPCPSATAGITLAPLLDGWVAEVETRQFRLGPSGEMLSERDTQGTALFAAPRVGDTPLVVRHDSYGVVSASLLDEAGDDVWTRQISDSVTEAQYGSAAAVSDGFLVALRTDVGVQVFHLDAATGTVDAVSSPGSASTEYPQLHAAAGEVRLVWADFGGSPQVHWAKLTEHGERIGDVVQIGASPDYFNRSPIVVDGEDTVVLFGGYTGGTGVGQATHLRRVAANGSTTAGDVAIQSDPNRVQWPQLVAFDGAFVTAWVGNGDAGRVGLAKLDL